jgi:hypothetical protein
MSTTKPGDGNYPNAYFNPEQRGIVFNNVAWHDNGHEFEAWHENGHDLLPVRSPEFSLWDLFSAPTPEVQQQIDRLADVLASGGQEIPPGMDVSEDVVFSAGIAAYMGLNAAHGSPDELMRLVERISQMCMKARHSVPAE